MRVKQLDCRPWAAVRFPEARIHNVGSLCIGAETAETAETVTRSLPTIVMRSTRLAIESSMKALDRVIRNEEGVGEHLRLKRICSLTPFLLKHYGMNKAPACGALFCSRTNQGTPDTADSRSRFGLNELLGLTGKYIPYSRSNVKRKSPARSSQVKSRPGSSIGR